MFWCEIPAKAKNRQGAPSYRAEADKAAASTRAGLETCEAVETYVRLM